MTKIKNNSKISEKVEMELGNIYVLTPDSDFDLGSKFVRENYLGHSLVNILQDQPVIEGRSWRSFSSGRNLLLQKNVENFQVPSPVFDLEASVAAFSSEITLSEFYGVDAILDRVFRFDGVPHCAKDGQVLSQHSVKIISEMFSGRSEDWTYLGVGSEVRVSGDFSGVGMVSDVLLWNFREARAKGVKRFLVDGRFVEVKSEEGVGE